MDAAPAPRPTAPPDAPVADGDPTAAPPAPPLPPPPATPPPAEQPPVKPLREGDDIAASGSQFGHFMYFVTDGLGEGESLTFELRLLAAPQVFGTPPKVYGNPTTEAGYFSVSADKTTWLPLWRAVEGVLKPRRSGAPEEGRVHHAEPRPPRHARRRQPQARVVGDGDATGTNTSRRAACCSSMSIRSNAPAT